MNELFSDNMIKVINMKTPMKLNKSWNTMLYGKQQSNQYNSNKWHC